MSLISALFTQEVVIAPFLREGAAEPIYGPPETRKCRLQRGRYLTNTNGADGTIDQVAANAKMFCEGEAIPERSLVAYGDQTYTVINCAVKNGFADNHLEVYLQ